MPEAVARWAIVERHAERLQAEKHQEVEVESREDPDLQLVVNDGVAAEREYRREPELGEEADQRVVATCSRASTIGCSKTRLTLRSKRAR